MDYSAEYIRDVARDGQGLTTVFVPRCPSQRELDAILGPLAAAGRGHLLVGIYTDGKLAPLGPDVHDVLSALRESATRLDINPPPSINATRLVAGWVAYAAIPEDPEWESPFEGLTASQARLLLAILRESSRERYRSTVVAVGTFKGWSLILSGSSGSESAEIKGDFGEIDLYALRDEGYVTLLVKPRQIDLSLKPVAFQTYRRGRQPPPAARNAPTSAAHHEVFICHAGPDKHAVVAPIVSALERERISHWYDSSQVLWGDSLTAKVNEGLRSSRYVLVVLSLSFHGRPWPERELNAALGLEAQTGASRILPLLVGSETEVQSTLQRYPLLADKRYLTWSGEPSGVVGELREVLNRT